MAARIDVFVIDLDIDPEDCMRPCAFWIDFSLGDDAHFFSEFNQLGDFFSRLDSLAGESLNKNFSPIVTHFQVSFVLVKQVIDVLVVNFEVADTNVDLALNHAAARSRTWWWPWHIALIHLSLLDHCVSKPRQISSALVLLETVVGLFLKLSLDCLRRLQILYAFEKLGSRQVNDAGLRVATSDRESLPWISLTIGQDWHIVAFESIEYHVLQASLKDVFGGVLGAKDAVKGKGLFCMSVLNGGVVVDVPVPSLLLLHRLLVLCKWLQSHSHLNVVV